ncbi:MAG: hypothetical protein AB1643_00775 [Patescibacteria group bacterium]
MDKYVKLAKETVENYIKKGEIISHLGDLPEEFYSRRTGVFVTISKTGQCYFTVEKHK